MSIKHLTFRMMSGLLELILLLILSEGPLSGYDIIKEIYERYGVLFSSGTIYPRIARMVSMGLIHEEILSHEGTKRRKLFSSTPLGKNMIKDAARAFVAIHDRIVIDFHARSKPS